MATLTRWKIWFKMIFGRSDLHINQPIGHFICPDKLYGYYNDMSNKVTFDKKTERVVDYIPIFTNDYGKKVLFPIQIIQYGLGCYELYLKTNDDVYLKKMIHCSDFILSIINNDGSISCMYFVNGLSNPYSAMCQGECISLLARTYVETNDKKYYDAAINAYRFLVDKNHPFAVTKVFDGLDYCLYEYPEKGIVLNGYIYALFGIYDAFLMTGDTKIKDVFIISTKSLFKIIDRFDLGLWSYYDLDRHYASAFYHKCHVQLLSALNIISDNMFLEYQTKWAKGACNKKLSRKMFWRKAKQKLFNQ